MARQVCRVVDADGTPVRIRGSGKPLTEQDIAALRELVAAVRRRAATESAEDKAVRAERLQAGIDNRRPTA